MTYYGKEAVDGLIKQAKDVGAEIHQINDDITVIYGEKVKMKTGIVTRIKTKDTNKIFRGNPEFVYTARFYNQIPKKYAKMIGVKRKVKVVCYGSVQEFDTREDALKEYMENISYSDGAEKERYATIVEQLYSGEDICWDGDEQNGIANYRDYKEKGAIKVA